MAVGKRERGGEGECGGHRWMDEEEQEEIEW